MQNTWRHGVDPPIPLPQQQEYAANMMALAKALSQSPAQLAFSAALAYTTHDKMGGLQAKKNNQH
eukprot:scaffold627399_cov46-Prasinocladus_malaysianus.AAC.1